MLFKIKWFQPLQAWSLDQWQGYHLTAGWKCRLPRPLSQELHFIQAYPALPPLQFVCTLKFEKHCLDFFLTVRATCARVSDWISPPNCIVKHPSLQNLLPQPALPRLDSQSSRVQDQACWVSFVFSSSFLKWESGGRELVSYVCFLCRCVLFKWKVSSGCTHTQIFPCWEHFLWKSK